MNWVDLRVPATVTIQVTGGTAQEGVDFTISQKVISASPENANNDLVITKLFDGFTDEGPETIELTLTNPTGGVVVGTPYRVTIILADDPNVNSFRLLLENPTGDLPLNRPREDEIFIFDNDPGYVVANTAAVAPSIFADTLSFPGFPQPAG